MSTAPTTRLADREDHPPRCDMMTGRVENAVNAVRMALIERVTRADWDDRKAEQLAQLIVSYLRQDAPVQHDDTHVSDDTLPRHLLRRVLRHVNDNLDSKLSWDEIAASVGLDPFRFGRSFRHTTQMTPHQYVIRCRLRRAMALLAQGDLDIAGIALDVGCSGQSHLTLLFRKYVGTTPAAFRKAARSGLARNVALPGTNAALSAFDNPVADLCDDETSLGTGRAPGDCSAHSQYRSHTLDEQSIGQRPLADD